jgi:endothelin-converting enzyme/putative endopeptidase
VDLRPLALAAVAIAACRTVGPLAGAAPAIDVSALDRKTAPCDDFYAFACGGWMARTEIPADKPMWDASTAVEERTLAELRGILDAAAAGTLAPPDRDGRRIGDHYAACMDEEGVEARGLGDLKSEWARLDAVADPATLAAALARLHLGGVPAIFGFGQVQDAKDATQVIGEVEQGGLTLPDRDYYLKDDARTAEIRDLYAEHLRKMLSLAGLSGTDADREASAVQRIETALAGSHWTQVELRDPQRTYNRVDLAGLEKLAPRLPWRGFLAELGVPGVTAITVTTPKFVERVGQLLGTVRPEEWRAYLRWHLLAAMAGERALPRAFVAESFSFSSAAFTGQKELAPRWKKCVRAVDDALGDALGRVYVDRFFGGGARERTAALVVEIEKAMAANLRSLPWMDAATRRKAEEKLSAIANKVGYPGRWRSYEGLEPARDSWFRSILAAEAFETRRQLAKIGRPVDRQEWLMTPPSVNAYYQPALNEMVFPAGILQPPFFNPGAPDAVNYGAIGAVVGHELTHGFDDQGRQYDAAGNLRDWWSPAVAEEFERRAACLVKQYGEYEAAPGAKLDGELTLGENIADLGGAKLAFAAHRAASERAPASALAGFTPDQQFFVGLAQAWCSKTREPFARMLAGTDPHSPPRHRVNGSLANLPGFAAAFRCQAPSPMARPPEKRCEVW